MRFLRSTFFIISLFIAGSTLAQDQIRIMNYNVLNFPLSNMPGREDTLKKIIDYIQPDLLLIQELRSEEGLNLILNESFNVDTDIYAASEYVPLQSTPNSSFALQQAFIYNTEVFGLRNESVVLTSYRDINELILYLKSPELENGADTTFIYAYSTHLKSSQGGDNEVIRNEMATTFVNHIEQLPANSYVILGGDFNIYSSYEDAYQTLLDSDNHIKLFDPIDSPGNWHSSSYSDKSILTQSTRSSQIYGDGASGGIDDRFDFILLSDEFFQNSEVQYVENSYKALGNNGNCYNSSLLDCIWGNEVPENIIRSLYNMSDHLPVVLDLSVSISLSQSEHQKEAFFKLTSANPVLNSAEISFISPSSVHYTLTTPEGKTIVEGAYSGKELSIDMSKLNAGLYLLNLRSEKYRETIKLVKAN